MFKGSFVALVSPMRADGSFDEDAYARFIDWQIGEGTEGLVPVGTTGESPTLTHEEHRRAIEIAVQAANKRVPVIAGAGSNSTAEAVGLARHAQHVGADAVMVVAPYYNKPSQEGLVRHYTTIADAIDIPLILYNVPGRSVVDISVETMARLAQHRRIVGVKDATANLMRPLHTRRACGSGFIQLSGEDHTVLSFMAAGGDGCISVSANIAPRLCAEMHEAWRAGQTDVAIALQDRMLALHDAMFAEPNPGPAKFGVSLLGFGTATVRLPLAPISQAGQDRVREAMTELGLLG